MDNFIDLTTQESDEDQYIPLTANSILPISQGKIAYSPVLALYKINAYQNCLVGCLSDGQYFINAVLSQELSCFFKCEPSTSIWKVRLNNYFLRSVKEKQSIAIEALDKLEKIPYFNTSVLVDIKHCHTTSVKKEPSSETVLEKSTPSKHPCKLESDVTPPSKKPCPSPLENSTQDFENNEPMSTNTTPSNSQSILFSTPPRSHQESCSPQKSPPCTPQNNNNNNNNNQTNSNLTPPHTSPQNLSPFNFTPPLPSYHTNSCTPFRTQQTNYSKQTPKSSFSTTTPSIPPPSKPSNNTISFSATKPLIKTTITSTTNSKFPKQTPISTLKYRSVKKDIVLKGRVISKSESSGWSFSVSMEEVDVLNKQKFVLKCLNRAACQRFLSIFSVGKTYFVSNCSVETITNFNNTVSSTFLMNEHSIVDPCETTITHSPSNNTTTNNNNNSNNNSSKNNNSNSNNRSENDHAESLEDFLEDLKQFDKQIFEDICPQTTTPEKGKSQKSDPSKRRFQLDLSQLEYHTTVNLVCVVCKVGPSETMEIGDRGKLHKNAVYLRNQSGLIELTLWDDQIMYEILMGKCGEVAEIFDVFVSSLGDRTVLSYGAKTKFVWDSNSELANELRNWYLLKGSTLEKDIFRQVTLDFFNPIKVYKDQRFVVRAKVVDLPPKAEEFFYKGCKTCSKKLEETAGSITKHYCKQCDKSNGEYEYRYSFWLKVKDETSEKRLSCFNNSVEHFLGSAKEVERMTDEQKIDWRCKACRVFLTHSFEFTINCCKLFLGRPSLVVERIQATD